MKRTAALAAVLGLGACGDPAPALEASTAKYADEWLVFAGSVPEDLYAGLNLHDTSIGIVGRLMLKDGAAHPTRNIVRTDTSLSFMVPGINAAYSGIKAEGQWTGQWTDNDGERFVVLASASSAPAESATLSELVALPDGRRMHIACTGEGAPVVVLDYGAGGTMKKDWGDIASAISAKAQARVCLYDRAGRGLSDPAPMPRDVAAVARDLDETLTAANIAPPYVLIGHSLGSYHVRQYANTQFDKVAGMVLVDPSGDGQAARFAAAIPKVQEIQDAAFRTRTELNCIARLREKLVLRDDPLAKECGSNDADTIEATTSEVEAMPGASTEQLIASRRSYGDMPLIVLTRSDYVQGMPPEFTDQDRAAMAKIWTELHEEMTALSTAGERRVVPNSGHYIQRDQPQAVIDAINDVVAKARARRGAAGAR